MNNEAGRVDVSKGMGKDVREVLAGAGADLGAAQPLSFYLYLPTQETAQQVANEIAARQLKSSVEKSADGKNWLCLAEAELLPEETALDELGAFLKLAADRHGGEFDGWEARLGGDEDGGGGGPLLALVIGQAANLIKADKFEEALQILPSAMGESGEIDSIARMLYTQALRKLGRYEEAVKETLANIERYPDDPGFRDVLGDTHLKLGNFDAALKTYASILEKDAENAVGHYGKACVYAKQGKSGESLDALAVALKLNKNMREHATRDEDLATLRGLPGFKKLTRRRFLGIF